MRGAVSYIPQLGIDHNDGVCTAGLCAAEWQRKPEVVAFPIIGVSPAKRAKRTLRNLNCKILIFPYA